jgi:hypothetical protein
MVIDHHQRHKQQHRNKLYPFPKSLSVRMNAEAVDIMLRILIKANGVPLPMHHAMELYRSREGNAPHITA